MTRFIFRTIVICTMLMLIIASTSSVSAWSGCAQYVTVQWGDTLQGIANLCGTTVDAIMAANPGIGWWLYVGQVLYIPTGNTPAAVYPSVKAGTGTYTVQRGDTLGEIAKRYGVSLWEILAVNPQIKNANLIYPGQVIKLPAGASKTTVKNPPATTYYPTQIPSPGYASGYSNLKVVYKHGLLVRTGPSRGYAEIKSPYSNAIKGTTWQYRKNSITFDSEGFVWVEVVLNQLSGYSTGWIIVKDGLGGYYTDPNINP